MIILQFLLMKLRCKSDMRQGDDNEGDEDEEMRRMNVIMRN